MIADNNMKALKALMTGTKVHYAFVRDKILNVSIPHKAFNLHVTIPCERSNCNIFGRDNRPNHNFNQLSQWLKTAKTDDEWIEPLYVASNATQESDTFDRKTLLSVFENTVYAVLDDPNPNMRLVLKTLWVQNCTLDGKIKAIATDGFRLACNKVGLHSSNSFGLSPALLPLLKLKHFDTLTVSKCEDVTVITIGDLCISHPADYHKTFPDYGNVSPSGEAHTVVLESNVVDSIVKAKPLGCTNLVFSGSNATFGDIEWGSFSFGLGEQEYYPQFTLDFGYLKDVLKLSGGQPVAIRVWGSNKPVRIDLGDYCHLIMPWM